VSIELRDRTILRKPTALKSWKAVSGRPFKRGRQESPESKAGACFHIATAHRPVVMLEIANMILRSLLDTHSLCRTKYQHLNPARKPVVA